jgi:hypothetical protein
MAFLAIEETSGTCLGSVRLPLLMGLGVLMIALDLARVGGRAGSTGRVGCFALVMRTSA